MNGLPDADQLSGQPVNAASAASTASVASTESSDPVAPVLPTAQQGQDRSQERAARRGRMRDFQQGLMERLRIAQSGAGIQVKRLGVLAGQTRWLVDLPDASELVPLVSITPVPLTHDWFLGMTNIRGNLVSVIDFARFEGGAPTVLSRECRILALAPALSFNSAILVSGVLGLHDVASMTPGPDLHEQELGQKHGQEQNPRAPGWAAQTWTDRQGQQWTRLDLSRVVRDPRFLNVGI